LEAQFDIQMPAKAHLPFNPVCHEARCSGTAVLLPGALPRRLPAIFGLRIWILLRLGIVGFFLLTALSSFGQTSPATLPNVSFATSGTVLALTQQDQSILIFITTVLMPGLMVFGGVMVWWRRRVFS